MHVHVEELPKKETPVQAKKRKYIIIGLVIATLICAAGGIYLMFLQPQPEPVVVNTTPEIPGYKIDFSYELGVIPSSFNQHVIKISHNGGDTVENINDTLWMSIDPPENAPYLRRSMIIHKSKYLEFAQGDVLYIYLGNNQVFYASKELPSFDDYIDFPDGKWTIHIDDGRYRSPLSSYEFNIDHSKTRVIKKEDRIQTFINSADPFDTLLITGKDAVYHEQLTIDSKPLRLYGIDSPIIDAGNENSVITILNSSYVEITGLHIINSGTKDPNDAGILIFYSDNTIIRNNTIYNNQNGIYLMGSLKNTIIYNQIYSNDISGLALTLGSNSNTVKENAFQINTFGIYVKDSSNTNYIVKNTGQGNTRYGIMLDNKLKNIYEYNSFSYDKMSYDKVVEENLTTVSQPKSDADTWLTTCGSHESPYSPACIGKKDTTGY